MTKDSPDHEIRKPDPPPGTEPVAKPRRRIVKTMLDVNSPELEKIRNLLQLQEGSAKHPDTAEKTSANTSRPVVEKPQSERKVARTLFEADLHFSERLHTEQFVDKSEYAAQAPSTSKPKELRVDRGQNFVAKTMLDSDVLATTLSKYQERKFELEEEEVRQRASMPAIEFHPVDSDKLVQPCGWSWEDSNSTERTRYCQNCHNQVYNFEGLELPQAEALIFKMENKRNPTLYKRADGKFMTQDCPVQLKRKRRLVLFSAVGATLFVALLVAVILHPPHLGSDPATEISNDVTEPEVAEVAHHRKKKKRGRKSPVRDVVVDEPEETVSSTGKRKRPTFTPADVDSYWE